MDNINRVSITANVKQRLNIGDDTARISINDIIKKNRSRGLSIVLDEGNSYLSIRGVSDQIPQIVHRLTESIKHLVH